MTPKQVLEPEPEPVFSQVGLGQFLLHETHVYQIVSAGRAKLVVIHCRSGVSQGEALDVRNCSFLTPQEGRILLREMYATAELIKLRRALELIGGGA